jgi:hypothetical protein
MTKYDLRTPDGQQDIQSDIIKRIRFESNPTELTAWTETYINEYKNHGGLGNKVQKSPVKKSKTLNKKNTMTLVAKKADGTMEKEFQFDIGDNLYQVMLNITL